MLVNYLLERFYFNPNYARLFPWIKSWGLKAMSFSLPFFDSGLSKQVGISKIKLAFQFHYYLITYIRNPDQQNFNFCSYMPEFVISGLLLEPQCFKDNFCVRIYGKEVSFPGS